MMTTIKSLTLQTILMICFSNISVLSQQIDINRIEQMPNLPEPYKMRDWKQVSMGYDNFVFDFNISGQYLPLIWWRTSTVNYNHISFGLHTVVGTTSPFSGEAINVLPAVISASLVGIDKSNQSGNNWVLMCEEYFNKQNGTDVYLNHPTGSNWEDWWYDTMPNIFFYQLYDMYPNTGDFEYQFTTVADRWLEAIEVMGGSSTPWQKPYMNYRAFNLITMTPVSSGVREPEAAGALAWILYNAYIETGNDKYRIGAEWAMEFLNELDSNPSYELQLAYGVYLAARMNAQIGTTYDVEKLINWCFNVGPLRSWGAIIGRWGNYDVHGLIGEVNGSNDYAFLMNTFEQVGALVPLVRYDDRFARTIGKWVLNASNAARLLYTNYLPDQNQDSEEWAHQYDPDSYIAYEALREMQYGQSPYATGDAISGGWGMTNLALYGSSHAGILGGIIDTTTVEKILQLDLLKTDYFHDASYPTYLYFNPFNKNKIVDLYVGNSLSDIYDAVSNTFLKIGVSGMTAITIPPDEAVVAVITPSGGTITYTLDKMMIDEVVIDYRSGQVVPNYPPRIKSLAADQIIILLGGNSNIYCTAEDRDDDPLSYSWFTSSGTINGSGANVIWNAPNLEGSYAIVCTVEDDYGNQVSDTIYIEVVEYINNDPIINSITADPRKIHIGTSSQLICNAIDPDGDELSFTWSSTIGSFSDSGSTVTWTAPLDIGNYYLNCKVQDIYGGLAEDSIEVSVRDTSIHQSGDLVAYYPFNGNANDESGYNNHGTVNGAALVADRFGNPNSAYQFDGINDYIKVPNSESLNFKNSITVSFWIKAGEFFEREAYPLSHGNWEYRWKVSITDKRIRWTIIRPDSVIKDLDSETELTLNNLYNVTTVYNGSDYEIYINGKLDALSSFSGSILQTNIDFMIGQVLPGDNRYNFKGVLDDIRIYNYALSIQEIINLYDIVTTVAEEWNNLIPDQNELFQNYPNPFNSSTIIFYQVKDAAPVSLEIYDILGNRIRSLVNEYKLAGYYTDYWDGKDDNGRQVPSGIYFYTLKTKNYNRTKKLVLLK
ncbi:MAG: T9SS type A sorting domain-containing protein [Bacteroidetes bacterium]|nr:T9SS type A sorting domain-containing protein [Bacteroidota bacterium]